MFFLIIIPGGSRISSAVVDELYRSSNVTAMLQGLVKEVIRDCRHFFLRRFQIIFQGLCSYEEYSKKYRNYEVRHILTGYPFSVGVILGYFMLKNDELRKLRMILNAKQYGSSQERIEGIDIMFTATMTQLFAIVLEKDSKLSPRPSFVKVSCSLSPFLNSSPKPQVSMTSFEGTSEGISDLRKRVEGFLHSGGIIPSMPKESDLNQQSYIDFEKEKNHLNKIDGERERLREKQRALQQEAIRLEDIKRQLQIYGGNIAGTTFPAAEASLLLCRQERLPVKHIKELEDKLKGMPALNISIGLRK